MKIKYNRAIKASSDGNEDIVMYWDGQKVYEGPADSDMTREIAWFLDDPEKLQEIVDYCNSFGDPVIEDTSDLMDVAATFVEMVGYELKEAESIDDDVYVSDEAGHFEIFEKSKEVTGAKKSVKAAEQDGNCDKSFKMQGTTYCIEMINDGGSYVAKWWDSSDNGLGYNNKGWVALNNDFGRNTGKFSSENIESLLSVISEYDRKPGKPVQDRIKREIAKLINFDTINSSCGRKSIKSSDGGWTTDELVDKMNNNYRKHKRNKQQKDAEKFNAFNKKYAKHGIELKPTDDSNYGAYQVINKGTPMDRLDDFRDMERYADSLIETEEYVNSSRNRFNPSAKTPIKSSDFEFVYDEDDEDYDDGDLSGYYSYDDLTPEQQDYAVAHWSDFSKCANTIYDWFNDDAMDWYHEDIDRIAEEYSEKYGFNINTDKMYWQSGSQGPYPDHWRNSEVFDKMYLGSAGNLTDVDLSFEGALTVEVYGDYYIGDQVAYGYSPSQLADNGANEQAVQIITNIAQGAQDFVDEAWKLIESTCSSYPDDEYVRGIFEGNPTAFTFIVDENGDIEDIA